MTVINGPASDCHLSHIWAVPQHDAAAAKLTTVSAVLPMIPEREQTSGHLGSKAEKEEGGKDGGHLKTDSYGKIQNLRPKSNPQNLQINQQWIQGKSVL